MTQYSKFNLVYRLQRWIDSVPGQTFLNYAYSWGASIVILGTLFKLTHLPGANLMLYLGMGTEVFVFFISAFDRPFDKTADGMDLPTHLKENGEEEDDEKPLGQVSEAFHTEPAWMKDEQAGQIIPTERTDGQMAMISQSVNPEMAEATGAYVEELKKITEVLQKVSKQSQRLTTDSEEMENLNRTLTGICKVYEMQLKSASSQIGTIDEINDQTRKMAKQIEQLNSIYARMIEAMTVNMNMRAANNGQTEGNG